MIIPTNLVCVFFGPTIPTSSFNFHFFFILVTVPFLLHSQQCFGNYTTSHGLSIRLSISLSIVKTIDQIQSSLSPAMHPVPVYDVLFYVYVRECMCMLCVI